MSELGWGIAGLLPHFFFKLAYKVDSCSKNPKIEIFKKLLWTLVIVWKDLFEYIYMIHSKLNTDPRELRKVLQFCQISFFQRLLPEIPGILNLKWSKN